MEPESALTAIQRFARCQNYPRGEEAQTLFADAVATASQETGVPIHEIIDRCLKISQYCPTDFDLLNVARDLKEERNRPIQDQAEREKLARWKAEMERDGLKPLQPAEFLSAYDGAKARLDQDLKMMKEAAERLGVPLSQLYTKSWGQIYAAMKDLGYKLNGAQQEIMAGTTLPPRKAKA